jgi:hypothetical protein
MALIREIGIAVSIVIIELWLQSAGLAALIHWVRHALAADVHRLWPLRSAVLVVRLPAKMFASVCSFRSMSLSINSMRSRMSLDTTLVYVLLFMETCGLG